MALGLESWRENYRQIQMADQAIQAIRQELQKNLDELTSLRRVAGERFKAMGEARKMIQSLADPKGAKATNFNFNLGFTFPDLHAAAWRSAGTNLLLHRMTFDRVQRVEQAYLFHDVMAGWVNQLTIPLLQASVDIQEGLDALKPQSEKLDPKQALVLDRSPHLFQSIQEQMVDYSNQAIATQKAALETFSR